MTSERNKPVQQRKNIVALQAPAKPISKPAGPIEACGRPFNSEEELEQFDPLFDDVVKEEAE